MRVLRARWVRGPLMFAAGILIAYVVARVWAPHWPGFCEEITIEKPCEVVAIQTMMGYLVIALGVIVVVLGPIASSLIDLIAHGQAWETPRGRETVATNLPIAAGIAYLVVGVVVVATA